MKTFTKKLMSSRFHPDILKDFSKVIERHSYDERFGQARLDYLHEDMLRTREYPVSDKLANILLASKVVYRSEVEMQDQIKKYNLDAGTNLDYNVFLSKNWLRKINGEVSISRTISFMANRVDEDFEKSPIYNSLNEEEIQFLTFLKDNNPYGENQVLISEEKLIEMSGKIPIEFWLEFNVFKVDPKVKDSYILQSSSSLLEYYSQEIDAILLNKYFEEFEKGNLATKFLKTRYNSISFFPFERNKYLTKELREKFVMSLFDFISKELDLVDISSEINKIILDENRYSVSHLKLPNVDFKSLNAYSIYQLIQDLDGYLKDALLIQSSRAELTLAINYIVLNDDQLLKYSRKLLSNVNNPFCIYRTLSALVNLRKEGVPYLLQDEDKYALTIELIGDLGFRVYDFKKENISGFPETIRFICDFQLRIFEEILGLPFFDYEANLPEIWRILLLTSKRAFKFNPHVWEDNLTAHINNMKLYEDTIEKFITTYSTNLNSLIFIKQIKLICQKIFDELNLPARSGQVFLNVHLLDMLFRICKTVQSKMALNEYDKAAEDVLKDFLENIMTLTLNYLNGFWSIEKITYSNYYTTTKNVTPSHNLSEFGLEKLDWRYFIGFINRRGKLHELYAYFNIQKLIKDEKEGVYNEINICEARKRVIYFKILCLGFFSQEESSLPNRDSWEELQFKTILFEKITSFALANCYDDLRSGTSISIFGTRHLFFTGNPYFETPLMLFIKVLDRHSDIMSSKEILHRFFEKNKNLYHMLEASNRLANAELKQVVDEMIEEYNFADFTIDWLPDLENALLETVNSSRHYNRTEDLLVRLERYYNKIKSHRKGEKQYFIFRVKMLLAFKNKDIETIKSLPYPKPEFQIYGNKSGQNIRLFYKALHEFYNKEDSNKALTIFEKIISQPSVDFSYVLEYYYIRCLSVIEQSDRLFRLREVAKEYRKNLNTKFKEVQQEQNNNEKWKILELLFSIAEKDFAKFNILFPELKDLLIEETPLVDLIAEFYDEFGLANQAYNLVIEAVNKNRRAGEEIDDNWLVVRKKYENKVKTNQIKGSITLLQALKHTYIPPSIPEVLNEFDDYNTFVLNEIINTLKLMKDKIFSYKKVLKEDNYNDIVGSLLQSRISFYGWSHHREDRSGTSATGKSAGEIDHTIKNRAETLSIFEAFRTSTRDKKLLRSHLLKLTGYNTYLENYIVIVFYEGKDLDGYWNWYQKEVENLKFPNELALLSKTNIQSLDSLFTNISSFRIGKSNHAKNRSINHLVIQF